ncbi:MAG: TonB-dependent receptor, partial [Opitutaceae bacterium]|nr:TonB-dependent receptor [Opitutaceae bacterium]
VGLALATLLLPNLRGQEKPESNPASDANKEVVKLDSLIVTGTRRLDRTASESMAPVDIIGEERLRLSVSPELTDKLMMDIPSFNVQRLPLSETTSFIRPARLRNLSPDHTLVLINGKRQHRTAGITSAATQAVDLAQIPASAIQRIEVLRDGASAQYGSDAIAGVINLILKRRTGVEGYLNFSQYYEGDGLTRQAGLNYGFALPKQGFLNLSLEYTNGDRTSRAIQRPDAAAYVLAHPDRAKYVANPVQPWGQPERETKRIVLNTEISPVAAIQLYAFGLYGEDKGTDDFNWRNPDTNGAFARSALQSGPNAIFPDFFLVNLYPGGFLPLFSTTTSDYTAVIGAKGVTSFNLNWDVSASAGRNVVDYVLSNSWNPSYGALSPTVFDVGGLRQSERNFNADFSYTWETPALAKPVNVAFGLESRREEFVIRPGERASWDRGPLIDLGVGANGYAGWTANQAIKKARVSNAGYADFDLQPTTRFGLALAVRYEDYEDFGSTTDGKISARFEATPEFAVRATASTGFHAPTPGLTYYTRTSSGPLPGTQINSQTGLVSVNNPVAIFFGSKPLQPETSQNFSFGAVYNPKKDFTISLDGYQIEVDDRITSSQVFTLTDAQRQQLAATGVVDALNINRINFFTNAFDTRTRGVDLVGSYRWTYSKTDNLTVTVAYNRNETKMLRAVPGLVSNEGRVNLESRLPKNVGNIAAEYQTAKYSVMGRLRYFGTWTSADSPTLIQTFSEQVLFDIGGTWKFSKAVTLSVGAENLFDQYPDKALFNVAAGLIYSRFSPYDTDGGRYYARLNFSY